MVHIPGSYGSIDMRLAGMNQSCIVGYSIIACAIASVTNQIAIRIFGHRLPEVVKLGIVLSVIAISVSILPPQLSLFQFVNT